MYHTLISTSAKNNCFTTNYMKIINYHRFVPKIQNISLLNCLNIWKFHKINYFLHPLYNILNQLEACIFFNFKFIFLIIWTVIVQIIRKFLYTNYLLTFVIHYKINWLLVSYEFLTHLNLIIDINSYRAQNSRF